MSALSFSRHWPLSISVPAICTPSDIDVCVRRVRAGSLLLLNSSIGAAETRLEAALHRLRAADAARRVVGVAGALQFAPPSALLVRLRVVGGGLGRVGALRDAGEGRYGRLPVCYGRVWYQCRAWGRWGPLYSA